MSVRSDVDRGLEIRERIERLQTELKDIETRLQMTALQHPAGHVPLADAERDGTRWLAAGSQFAVPVIFTADLLIGSLDALSPRAQTLRTAARGKLGEFFKSVTKLENRFTDGKAFRKAAHEILDAAAPNFITQCLARDKDGQPKNRVVVAWKEAEPASVPRAA